MKQVFLFLSILPLFFSCSEDGLGEGQSEKSDSLQALLQEYQGPPMEAHGVHSYFTDSSLKRLRLDAPVQRQLKNGDTEFPEGMYVEFFSDEGIKTSTLKAGYGILHQDTEIWNLRSDVQLYNIQKQQTLKSEELQWETKQDSVRTTKYVKVITPQYIIDGLGLRANTSFTGYKFYDVTGKYYIDESD